MQLAMIEFARNMAGIKNATSMEFDEGGEFIIHYMEGQTKEGSKGGSMRLGAYDCKLSTNTLAHKIYNSDHISERHRHRLEVNNKYTEILIEKGMVISGINEKLNLVEVIELSDHPFFIACQYHPEFKSRPFKPHPLFERFITAGLKRKGERAKH
jgi:CTP synthase